MPTPLTVPVYDEQGDLVEVIPLYHTYGVSATTDGKTKIHLVPLHAQERTSNDFRISHVDFKRVGRELGWPEKVVYLEWKQSNEDDPDRHDR